MSKKGKSDTNDTGKLAKLKREWPDFADIMENMMNDSRPRHPVEYFLPKEKLPAGFEYPESYCRFIEHHPDEKYRIAGLNAWCHTGDLIEHSEELSQQYGRPLILFARACSADRLACFEGTPGATHRVIVVDPWAGGGPIVFAELDSFEEWLEWAKDNW